MINVIIVDDHKLVRNGIKRILESAPGIKIVGEASSGEEALQVIKQLQPHVVLMDIKMPGLGGIETTRKLVRLYPELKIIIVTAYENEVFPVRMFHAGAHGYLTKGASEEEMLRAIRAVQAGQRHISAEIAGQLALKSISGMPDSPFSTLSEREMQICLLIIQGAKVQEIAEKLHLSPKTVNSYRYRVFDKLGVKSDVELTHLSLRYGLLDAESL